MTDPAERRAAMVARQIAARGIDDERVLAAMRAVPRERFVPAGLRDAAFDDRALPIGHGVTISQPYIVALMTSLARVEPGERVLEIGTGSGYQAAVLAELGAEVYTIERLAALHEQAKARLGADPRVHLRHGDGFVGWPDEAPFAAILLTAAPERLPEQLLAQLRPGGRLIAPLGPRWVQSLVVIEATAEGPRRRHVLDVAFVPMLSGLA